MSDKSLLNLPLISCYSINKWEYADMFKIQKE